MKYPIFVLSKGRADRCLTANLLREEGVPFRIAVENEEAEAYAARYGAENLIVMPFNNLNQGATPAANYVKDYAATIGLRRFWMLEDIMTKVLRFDRGKGTRCSIDFALSTTEDFIDRYENVAAAGLTSSVYAFSKTRPFQTNIQVYFCVLLRADLPFRYRGVGNQDTDFSLQVLSGGWTTVLMNIFAIVKPSTGTMKGGCTDTIYKTEGRERRVRQLQEFWPDLGIKMHWRYGWRPHEDLNHVWRRFRTPLRRVGEPDGFRLTPPDDWREHWVGMPSYSPRKEK